MTIPMPKKLVRIGFPWMIIWAIGVHLIWAFALFMRGTKISSLLILVGLNRFEDSGLGSFALAMILTIAALMAIFGLAMEDEIKPKVCLALLLPQYGLMLAALLSDLQVIITARNPMNDAHVDRVLLLTVLGPMILAAALHTLAILERFVFEPRAGRVDG